MPWRYSISWEDPRQGKEGDVPFSTSSIRADHDGRLPIGNLLLDIRHERGFGEEVVDGNVEKALDLRSVEVHGDDVVGSSDGEKISDKSDSQRRSE